MTFPISRYDGFDLGSFDETDKQQTDTYSNNRIPKWYGWIDEYKNDRTDFVANRRIDFNTLHQGIYQRLNSVMSSEHLEKRPASFGENEIPYPIPGWDRMATNTNIIGNVPVEIAGEPRNLSAINEFSIVTAVDRYAYSAPPEMKLSAAIEFAVWKLRQPIGSNHANAFVRSGAASFLDSYRYRSI